METSPFSKDFIAQQKVKLLETKKQILTGLRSLNDLQMSEDDLHEEGDLGNAIVEQNYAIALKERDIKRLREIEEALYKIERGGYGVCEDSGEPIELQRLVKIPWAKLSIEAAEMYEREMKKYIRSA